MVTDVAFYATTRQGRIALYATDRVKCVWHHPLMADPTQIHPTKSPRRIHFIEEWAAKRQLTQADVARQLNVERSTVKRWYDGTIPTRSDHLEQLAELFALDDPSMLFRHPDDDWMARLFEGRTKDELDRMIQMLDLAFPRHHPPTRKTGNGES
ncbi:helix-turn-helix domain-containing protein [Pannonibacter tanglangensis]|nr:helix-turn-helix transcriptional regulator [Pannonibacter sp. XCT-34]